MSNRDPAPTHVRLDTDAIAAYREQGFRRTISAHYSSTQVTWEWTVQPFNERHYRIVRGDRAGQEWQGERNTESPIDPLDYIPIGPATQLLEKR